MMANSYNDTRSPSPAGRKKLSPASEAKWGGGDLGSLAQVITVLIGGFPGADVAGIEGSKTSLIFTTRHHPGALYDSLGEFARRNINLLKIESRPRRNRPWQYLFYLDFEGHWQDPECETALMGLLRRSSFVKLLGSYPAATTPFDEL